MRAKPTVAVVLFLCLVPGADAQAPAARAQHKKVVTPQANQAETPQQRPPGSTSQIPPQPNEPKQPASVSQKQGEESKGFHLTFDNVAGALGILFGAIGLIAFLDQRRVNRQQQPLMGYIQRNMTKDVSEETIAELTQQLKEMERQTKEEMPKLARRAVLIEQSQRLQDAISESYSQWKSIETELGSLAPSKLNVGLEAAITDRMMPSYLTKMKIEASQQRLTIGASAIALCSFILPYPLDAIVGLPLAVWLLPSIIQLLNSSGVTESTKTTIQRIYRGAMTISIVALSIFFYSVVHHRVFDEPSSFQRMIGNIAALVAVLLLIAAYPLDRAVRKWCSTKLIVNGKAE